MTTPENDANSERSSPSPRDDGIQSPYDRLINRTLQQVEAARNLLAFHLPGELILQSILGVP